jgi:hypothetical protein
VESQRNAKTSSQIGLAASVLDDRSSIELSSSNTVHYTIDAQIIHNIFVEFPAVHKAYKENVPLKVSTVRDRQKYYSLHIWLSCAKA